MDFETSKHWLFVVSGFRISPEPASCTLNSCQAEYQHHAATEPGLMAPRGPSGSLWPSPRTTPSRSAPHPGGCWIPPRTGSAACSKETNPIKPTQLSHYQARFSRIFRFFFCLCHSGIWWPFANRAGGGSFHPAASPSLFMQPQGPRSLSSPNYFHGSYSKNGSKK